MNSPGIYPGEIGQDRRISPPFENDSQCENDSQGGAGEGFRYSEVVNFEVANFEVICTC
jgi:hypothetical protein